MYILDKDLNKEKKGMSRLGDQVNIRKRYCGERKERKQAGKKESPHMLSHEQGMDRTKIKVHVVTLGYIFTLNGFLCYKNTVKIN